MINQNQLQSSEEKMVDLFQVEELESRLEMCGSWADDDACSDGSDSGGPSGGGGGGTGATCRMENGERICVVANPGPAQD